MEPEEYCRKWVPIYQDKKPGERGYRAACIRELARVSGVKGTTIDINWGSDFSERPSYLPKMLALAHTINLMKQMFSQAPGTFKDEIMFEPMEPKDFCAKWVPRKSNFKPGEYGYRKECCEFLASLTGYNEDTCSNWLSTPSDVPKLARMYFRLLDTVWEIDKLLPKNVNNFKE
ncbi:hypothetical protein DSM106972_047910 [Dulcicalothrix desertica PCC 7102]|uniref:Uncharacterized protein n=1 Tax=Dulcicalothrix desertica PCC 7102 TaxID=232991 RepID=A0A433VCV2_9CYAN|nr:hypothetical protein [Dulcicalothrix desertica]RUT03877.1 hypothetical protein DSM106972_047910 [Dulcicalothrix desertica PCC 7102]TWH43712.1 hypothetical protein CAL7102_07456 [Dulcicalothrix desertica PCC 7102]